MTQHFYTSIAKYYPYIFPFNPLQVKFLSNILPYNGARIMDVGCASGELSFALTKFGFPVWAFDFDAEMIEMAQNTKPEETMFPLFEQLDMRLLDQHYPESFFDTVICFGNTLVHLQNDQDIRQFLHASCQVLSSDGTLTIQILNYRYILENQIKSLPTIDNEQVHFDRKYEFKENSGLIDFNTQLTIKSTGQLIQNTVQLYPITKDKLHALLEETGFKSMEYFGSFASEPLQADSQQLIVSCKKKL
ncbi:MAG TPA: class I SAM-dependent methyltransferase [Prolixibacteraceae bacterium]|jgi:SAM-dependent methyltransferase